MGKLLQYSFLLGFALLMASPSGANIREISNNGRLPNDIQSVEQYFIRDISEEIKKWPLSIQFSQDVDHEKEWLFGVHLIIFNEAGEIIFNDIVNAPIFLANIPPGTYCLFGAHDGVGRSEMFEIIDGTTLNITMHWG